jgi:dTDP-4-amino-4,6-dideoxygalactose transaminase
LSNADRIPFLDLVTPHRELKEELSEVFSRALESAAFIGGPMVEEFERDFAAFCATRHCVGVGSGTDALRFALMAAGVGEGDIVVTVPNTFIATTEAISQAGARPVFVDIDEQTYNMDPERLREYFESECFVDGAGCLVDRELGKRVAAVVPVHLYGQPADMDPILELAEKYRVIVIEDACQAHGAEYFSQKDGCWKKAGSMGHATAFSFYPGKNLGACGEGGAVTTNDAELAQRVRMLRDHGQAQKYYHDIEGYNGRLDAIQAGILKVKLGRLAACNEQRRESAKRYGELLGSTEGVALPVEPAWSQAVYHLYVVRVQDRNLLQQHLAAENIGTAIHYPVPLHLQKAYAKLGYHAGDFPIAERCAAEIVSLPMFPALTDEETRRVAEGVQAFLSREPAAELVAAAASAGD